MKKVLFPMAMDGETKGARRATGVSPTAADTGKPAAEGPPDPEVPEQARRRLFSAEYKLRILREADACSEPGEVGALLRREGLYSSLLSTWRRQREQGALEGLRSKKRGRKAIGRSAETQELEQLRKENEHLQRRLDQAELIIDVQKNNRGAVRLPVG